MRVLKQSRYIGFFGVLFAILFAGGRIHNNGNRGDWQWGIPQVNPDEKHWPLLDSYGFPDNWE